ncbi:hypothetical protein KDH_13600 [Dictyobacter sp. S3.2.2.5]|uniref:DUF4386 family protein n=1 Tax=Dictyobacter halimunensis TaxID=3026934 RepID=A0ABQ6FNW8_9CHLR|nr:hypothetical protein KDH_13600 [Dictyobacter sp. S3.2.2.5]
MSSTTLYRLSALSLLIGCVLVILGIVPGFFLGDQNPASTINVVSSIVRLVGAMLAVLGLPGVYAASYRKAGVLALIGVVGTFIWLAMAMAFELIIAFVLPFLAEKAPKLTADGAMPAGLFIFLIIGGLITLIASLMLGIVVLRSHISSRLIGILLIIGAIVSFVGNFLPRVISDVGIAILLIALAWIALGVWSRREAVAQETFAPPTSVRA